MSIDSSEYSSDISPRLVYERAVKKWRWVALWIIVGALAGWAVSTLRQPLYEARAGFNFNIDYTLSGVLTDVEEDQVLEAAGDLLRSTEVRTSTISDASKAGIVLSEVDVKDSVFIERRNNAWLVIVRRADGEEAAKIANLWGENFEDVYREAYLHALTADGLQRYLNSLESCLRETVVIEPAQAGCQLGDLQAVQAELTRTGEEIHRERLAGKNLFAGMLFEWSEKAAASPVPIRFDRNKFVLFGALTGLIFSLWFIETWPFPKKASAASVSGG